MAPGRRIAHHLGQWVIGGDRCRRLQRVVKFAAGRQAMLG
jgi:hypothetical protein